MRPVIKIDANPLFIPNDAWAYYTAPGNARARGEIEALTADFLAKGGQVQEVPPGATGAREGKGFLSSAGWRL